MSDARGAATFRTSAETYDRYIGRYAPELARTLVQTAGVRPGARALDVGCGPGALTRELVSVLGADHVTAIDPSPPFADACRARLPGVDVHVGAAEALPFVDGAFGHALAQLVVNFMTDAHAGVREMRRVTRPGGTVTAAVWDYRGEMRLLRTFWDAVAALDPSAADRDEGQSMAFSTPGELGDLWSASGLAVVNVSPAVVAAHYDGIDDLWAPLELGIAPSGAYVVSLAPEERLALKAELARRLRVGGDPFRLTARAWIVTGRVP